MKHITLGVAGHIDHGKTALVRALTGTETDRLPEEQVRGMSIVLGFAHLETPDGDIDVIDVPGHERFVHTMIAGATGIEAVMLVIGANEIVMPQTREHVALVELLGVRKGLVVLTKSDLVTDPDERALVQEEARAFLGETFLRDAPLFWVSAQTGEGLEALQGALRALLAGATEAPALPQFFLPVDRVFTMTGHGLVVTGTLRRGALCVGQAVEIVPGGRRAEVRGLEVHGSPVARAEPGRRTAVNLRGVRKEDVRRGDALTTRGALRPTRLLDVELRLLPDAPPLTRGQSVRLYYGTSDTLARVHPLSGERIAPGGTTLAQLRLTDEIHVPVRERFVLRAISPVVTLGGGVIVDAAPQRHRLNDADAQARVQALTSGDAAARVGAKLAEAADAGRDVSRLAADLGLTPTQLSEALAVLPLVRVGELAVLQDIFDALCHRAIEAVHGFHAEHPTRQGMPREDLRRRLPKTLAASVFGAILGALVGQGLLAAEDGLVREASFSPEAMLSPVERAIAAEIEGGFRHGGLKPPNLGDVVGPDRRRKNLYHLLREAGRVIETSDRDSGRVVVFHREVVAEAVERLRRTPFGPEGASVSELNQVLGITRKYAIPLLEYLDAEGVTKRVGDRRIIRTPSGPASRSTSPEAGEAK